jgi:hypothetical protein
MNAERLHAIAVALRQEMHDRKTLDHLQNLVTYLQDVAQQSNTSTQQDLSNGLTNFYEAVTNPPSDAFTPAWRQILVEMGGAELFGKLLKQRVEKIIAENQMTPVVAHEKLQTIHGELTAFMAGLDSTLSGLRQFKIGTEQLAPGEAEITVLIPRQAVDDKLGEFADELHELEFILNTFAQVSTGKKEDLKIKTISSSALLVYLLASPACAACVAKSIDYVVGLYKKLLEVRKLRLEIDRLEMPEISEQMKERANKIMAEGLDDVTVKIIDEFYVGKDGGRKNELTTSVHVSLNRIANRIDKGFNIEVRIEPLKVPTGGANAEVTKAQAIIHAAAPNMQYLKLEGPAILALPENSEASARGPESKGAHKRRIRLEEDEPKSAHGGRGPEIKS